MVDTISALREKNERLQAENLKLRKAAVSMEAALRRVQETRAFLGAIASDMVREALAEYAETLR